MRRRDRIKIEGRYQFRRFDGPLAIVGVCDICGYSDTIRKPPPGYMGRGWGMREGNKQRGRMIQHFNANHKTL